MQAGQVDQNLFSGAPRFHSGGITGDEVPIIAQRGEGVFTPAQMRALAPVGAGGGNAGPISVTIVNQTGQAANATARHTEGGGIEVLLTAVKESIAEDIGNGTGPVNAALSSRYNLRPSMA